MSGGRLRCWLLVVVRRRDLIYFALRGHAFFSLAKFFDQSRERWRCFVAEG